MNGSGSGLFIVVEGPEGAGKSTLVRWLAARLRGDGRRGVAVRQRTARKVQDRIERQDDAFHARVREAYRRAQGSGVVHIDASLSRKAVQEAAWREVTAAAALSTRGMS